jgi:probable rRNA maturation factor
VKPPLIVIQNHYLHRLPFKYDLIKSWANQPLLSPCRLGLGPTNEPSSNNAVVGPRPNLLEKKSELTLRFVTNDEIQSLNQTYRQQNKPTNVLAFPSQVPDYIPLPRRLLGDVIIAPDVLYEEHRLLHKALDAYWAHIIIHGILHLLGYQHEEAAETMVMQTEETRLMNRLNFPNPYPMEYPNIE